MEPILKSDLLRELEYFFQLSFFTADLHITRAWSVPDQPRTSESADDQSSSKDKGSKNTSPPQEPRVPSQYKTALAVASAVELGALAPTKSLESIVKQNVWKCPWNGIHHMHFPLGILDPPEGLHLDPTGSYTFVVFQLFMARTSMVKEKECEIPSGYDSLVYSMDTEKQLRVRYRVKLKHAFQVKLNAVVEFQFQPLRIDVTPPICDHCEAYDATVYCTADEVHLCDTCDAHQHASNKLFMRHRRVPVAQSPSLFGVCREHPTECITMCCITCYEPLCSLCLIFGAHSRVELKDHKLLSTIDTYELALSSFDDKKPSALEEKLRSQSLSIHYHIQRARAHADALMDRIRRASKAVEHHIDTIRTRKLQCCDAVERRWVCTIQTLEWTKLFIHHIYRAVPPTHVLTFHKRHLNLLPFLFGSATDPTTALIVNAPHAPFLPLDHLRQASVEFPEWVLQPVQLVGSLIIKRKQSLAPTTLNALLKSKPSVVTSQEAQDNPIVPSSNWVSFQLNKPACVEEAHSYHAVTTSHDKYSIAYMKDAMTSCNVYEGPVIYAEAYSTPVDDKNTRHGSLVGPVSTTTTPLGEMSRTDESKRSSAATAYPVLQSGIKLSEKGGGDEVESREDVDATGKRSNVVSRVIEIPNKQQDMLRETLAHCNAHIQPNESICEEVWALLKEYRFEALIMILKTCPIYRRLHLMRYFCNAANSMSDFENVVHVIFEVERYWVSRLPSSMLESYPSLIVPLMHHVFQSREIFLTTDQQFLTNLVEVPFQRICACLNHCMEAFDENNVEGCYDSLSNDKPVHLDSELCTVLRELLQKKTTATEPLHHIVFEKLHSFVWKQVNDALLKHVLVLTAGDLPCTVRSLLYYLGEYGSSLGTIQYPRGVLNNEYIPFNCGTVYHKVDDTSSAHWHVGDEKCSSKMSTVRGHMKPNVATCVEAFLSFGLAPRLRDPDASRKDPVHLLTTWLLRVMYKRIAQAVWRLPSIQGQVTRFQLHIKSDDQEMRYITSAYSMYRWMDTIVSVPKYKKQFRTNLSDMPRAGYTAFQHIMQSIVELDEEMRLNPSHLETSWEACTAHDLLVRTRNFERLVLASVTYCQRRSPLSLNL